MRNKARFLWLCSTNQTLTNKTRQHQPQKNEQDGGLYQRSTKLQENGIQKNQDWKKFGSTQKRKWKTANELISKKNHLITSKVGLKFYWCPLKLYDYVDFTVPYCLWHSERSRKNYQSEYYGYISNKQWWELWHRLTERWVSPS